MGTKNQQVANNHDRGSFGNFSRFRPTFTIISLLPVWFLVEMAWAAKRPTNEPLTGLFSGPPTAQFYFLFLISKGGNLATWH